MSVNVIAFLIYIGIFTTLGLLAVRFLCTRDPEDNTIFSMPAFVFVFGWLLLPINIIYKVLKQLNKALFKLVRPLPEPEDPEVIKAMLELDKP